MRVFGLGKMVVKVVSFVVISGVITTNIHGAEEYSFKVHNTTDIKIKEILVSEDGKSWGFFDIGSGIKAGRKVTLIWGAHTNSEDCKQYFKATFSDNTESEPVIFDFCEEDLELEF